MPPESEVSSPTRIEPTIRRPTLPQGDDCASSAEEDGKEETTISTEAATITVKGEKSNEKLWEKVGNVGLVLAGAAAAAIGIIIGKRN